MLTRFPPSYATLPPCMDAKENLSKGTQTPIVCTTFQELSRKGKREISFFDEKLQSPIMILHPSRILKVGPCIQFNSQVDKPGCRFKW